MLSEKKEFKYSVKFMYACGQESYSIYELNLGLN